MFRPLLLSLALSIPCLSQVILIDGPWRRPPLSVPVRTECRIRSVDVNADVNGQAATVRIAQVFHNPSSVPMEAQLLFPLPRGAAVTSLTLVVDGQEMTGRLLGKEEARRAYEEIVRRRRDPALLEYVGRDLFETNVFPVPPHKESTVQIRYSQFLPKDSGLVDFLLPIGAARHSAKPVETLKVTVHIAADAPIRTVYSPTHQAAIERSDSTHAVSRLTLQNVTTSDDFRLLYSTDANPVGLNVISYKPSENEDGYFVLLATPGRAATKAPKIAKTAIFICDRSGSMSGQKMEQVKSALQYFLRQLQPTDTFNIVAYDTEVETFRPEIQRAAPATISAALAWVGGLAAGGGTNIDGALKSGLGMLHDPSQPAYIFFLTDGQPTIGERNEVKIAENAAQANGVHARLFAFGVGFDVNGRLLDRIARELRGQSVYVRPNEDIEAPVSALYAKVGSPAMTNVAIDIQLDGGSVSRLYPRQLPDLFEGDQLVLVGRYKKGGAARIQLTGTAADKKQTLSYHASFAEHTHDDNNAFVARLWAMRRIGEIIDDLDLHGRNQELIDELVALSQRYGIMTPYTSFLTDDKVNLSDRRRNVNVAAQSVAIQMDTVSGASGFTQRESKAAFQNATNMQMNQPGAPAQQSVQNIGTKAFFKKNRVWQDSTVTDDQARNAIHVVQFGREYFDLAASDGGRLAPYLAIKEPMILNVGAKTYQIDPAQ